SSDEQNVFDSTDDEQDANDSDMDAFASSDEEEDVKETREVPKIPELASKKTKSKDKSSQLVKDQKTAVVYVGRIPHGFYEDEMKGYFGQFGTVKRLRLSRNKRTGRSKHYAYIEFEEPEVAEIVADTMNNYLLFGHILKVIQLSVSQVHPQLFDGANRKFKAIPWAKIAKQKNDNPTEEQESHRKQKAADRQKKKNKQLKKLNIDY
ncbi:hypothetical protein CANCADRAFT_16182, partial [Tortispora caseinolytica NRRL Y-17796]